jgi:MFS family permease
MANTLYQNRDFMRLWAAQIGSAFGSRITRTVLPIIAIVTMAATPTQVGLLAAAGVAAGMVAAAFVGTLVDRTPKRRILIAADVIRAIAIVFVPVVAYFDGLGIHYLHLTAAIVGAATVAFQIADNSYLPVLVGKEALVEGNAKLEATDSIAEATGPGLAGILVDLLTAPIAILIDAATYLWSALMISRIKASETANPDTDPSQGLITDALSGFRICWNLPTIRSLLLADVIMSFFGGFFFALYMVLGLSWLGLSAAVLGLIISVGGIGAFIGAALVGRAEATFGFTPTLVGSLAFGLFSSAFIPLSLMLPDWSVWLLCAGQLFGDGFLTIFMVLAISYRQRIVAQDRLGRVNATFQLSTQGALLLGTVLAGPLSALIGFEPVWWLVTAGYLLAVPLVWLAMKR